MYRLFFWIAIVTVLPWIAFSAFVAIAMR